MSEIKRYSFERVTENDCDMLEYLDGQYVEFEDHQAKVKELESQLAEAKKGAERYEIIRKLHPHEFANLWRKNIGGEGLFDDLVDAAIKENQQ